MTQARAGLVLKVARGQATGFVKVVKASNGRYGATHAATKTNELACGTKPHAKATITGPATVHRLVSRSAVSALPQTMTVARRAAALIARRKNGALVR